jgi:dephospho-CoA kinase
MAHKPVIGLVGGIGSGKSVVAAALARRGGFVIAGDVLGHEALRQPAIRDQVVKRWGRDVLNEQGEIDRRRLGAIVFRDPAELRTLESFVFPWIERRIGEEIARSEGNHHVPFIVLDAAILLEAGWNGVCDRIVFVNTPREQRLKRLKDQRGWSEKEVQAREHAQMSLSEKQNRADAVIDNTGPPENVERQVEALLRTWSLVK